MANLREKWKRSVCWTIFGSPQVKNDYTQVWAKTAFTNLIMEEKKDIVKNIYLLTLR